MAQRIETIFIDDLDGSAAEGTVLFGLDGTQYEIDLSPGHTSDLRNALAPYIGAARRAAAPRRAKPRLPAGSQNGTVIRTWAKARGIQVSDRGRIPAHILTQYQEGKDS